MEQGGGLRIDWKFFRSDSTNLSVPNVPVLTGFREQIKHRTRSSNTYDELAEMLSLIDIPYCVRCIGKRINLMDDRGNPLVLDKAHHFFVAGTVADSDAMKMRIAHNQLVDSNIHLCAAKGADDRNMTATTKLPRLYLPTAATVAGTGR